MAPVGCGRLALDAYLENEAQEGYRLECMVNLPDALTTKLRVVTIHND